MASNSAQTVNRLNLHYVLHMVGWYMAGNFFVAFLLARGLSPVEVILAFTTMVVLRLVLRPMILWIAPRLGLRNMIGVGAGLFMIQYACLSSVHGIDAFFWGYCALRALSDVFYWSAYHAAFSMIGDPDKRGKQVGLREAMINTAAVIGPLTGGWLLDTIGAHATYGIAAFFDLISLIPLAFLPVMKVQKQLPEKWLRRGWRAGRLLTTDSWLYSGFQVAWAIVLFNGTGASFTAFGGAMTLASVVSVAGGYLLGRQLDKGRGSYAAIVNGLLLTAAIVLRVTAHPSLPSMYAVAMTSALVTASYTPTLMTAVYALTGKSESPFHTAFLTESFWDVGAILGSLTGALLVASGLAVNWAVAVALLSVPIQAWLLRRFYKKDRRDRVLAAKGV